MHLLIERVHDLQLQGKIYSQMTLMAKYMQASKRPNESAYSNFLLNLLLDLFMCIKYLHVWLYTTCVPGTYRGEKRALYSLKLQSQVVICHNVGSGNEHRSATRTSRILNHWAISPAPIQKFLMWYSKALIKWNARTT